MRCQDDYEETNMPRPEPLKHVVQPGRPKKNARKTEAGEALPGQNKVKRIRIGGLSSVLTAGNQVIAVPKVQIQVFLKP